MIEPYNATNNFDIVCFSDEHRINIAGYSLLRADHPSNMKKRGICIYYTDFLPLVKKDDITDLNKVLVAEIIVDNKKCFFTCLYKLPSQNFDQFSDFCKDCNIHLNNIKTIDHQALLLLVILC